MPRCRLADLVEGPVDHAGVRRVELDEAHASGRVAVHALVEHPAGHPAEPGREPVDAGERGEGVVDGGRERPDGDLDELVDGEDRILHQRAVRTGDMGLGQRLAHFGRRPARPHHGQRPAGRQEVPRPVLQADHRVGPRGDGDQLGVADVLDVAAHLRGHDRSPLLNELEQFGHRLPRLEAAPRAPPVRRPARGTPRRSTA